MMKIMMARMMTTVLSIIVTIIIFIISTLYSASCFLTTASTQWGAAEIKVPSGENTELKHSPFKAWSWSVCNHTCLFLSFRSIHLHFFQNLSRFFLCWLWLTHGSCVGLQNKIGHPAGGRFPCCVPAEYK